MQIPDALFRAGLLLVLAAGLVFPTISLAGDRVLVLTASDRPIVHLLANLLKAENGALPIRRSRVELDVRVLGERQSEEELVRQIVPTIGQYRAIFATNMSLARAMQLHTAVTPIIFDGGADPLSMCLVDSLRRPGRNATGYIHYLPGDDGKMMELLIDGFPRIRQIYYVVAADNVFPATCDTLASRDAPNGEPCRAGVRKPDSYLDRRAETAAITEAAKQRGLDVHFVLMCSLADFELLVPLGVGKADVAFMLPWQEMFSLNAQELVDQMARTRRPAIYGLRKFVKLGGVMSVEPIRDDSDYQVPINMLLQVLDGRAPATLPVQVPRGFSLTVNGAAAAAQGLRPSLKLLRRADEVILEARR